MVPAWSETFTESSEEPTRTRELGTWLHFLVLKLIISCIPNLVIYSKENFGVLASVKYPKGCICRTQEVRERRRQCLSPFSEAGQHTLPGWDKSVFRSHVHPERPELLSLSLKWMSHRVTGKLRRNLWSFCWQYLCLHEIPKYSTTCPSAPASNLHQQRSAKNLGHPTEKRARTELPPAPTDPSSSCKSPTEALLKSELFNSNQKT